MSKKKTKQKKHYITKTNKFHQPKPLKDKLQDVYYGTINLDSICKGNISCCKTSCPQMFFSEFSSLIQQVWDTTSRSEKVELICTSIEYFFRNEFEKWGMDTLVKPCLLLDEKNKKCRYYEERCLNCRLYGLWPKKDYNERVDKFEKAYKGLLKRKELPLNTQCPHVKRIDESKELTTEVINGLFEQLDKLDEKVGRFSALQMSQKENYRTFHDWLLLKIFGETWLSDLTTFMLAANKDMLVEQVEALKDAVKQKFAKDMPDIKGI